jgi:hypothetical protein
MFSLQDLLGQENGQQAVDQISQNVGAEPSMVNSAVQMALPMIIGALSQNASQPGGAESLSNALQNDHDGSILDNIGGLISGAQSADGGGILGHILGQKQTAAAEQISQNTGLNTGQVLQILLMLAPIVMGYLGKQKREQGLDAGGLTAMLGQQQQQIQSSGNPMMNMVTSFLDSDHDGSALDDLASMAMKYMTNK